MATSTRNPRVRRVDPTSAEQPGAQAADAPELPRRLQREFDVSRARTVTLNEMETRLAELRDGLDPQPVAEAVPPDPVDGENTPAPYATATTAVPPDSVDEENTPAPYGTAAASVEEAPPYQNITVPSEPTFGVVSDAAASATSVERTALVPAQEDGIVKVPKVEPAAAATTRLPAGVAPLAATNAATDVAAHWARAAETSAPTTTTPLYPTAELEELSSAPETVIAPVATAPPSAVAAPAPTAPAAAIDAWNAHIAPMTKAERLQRYDNGAIAAERDRARNFHEHHLDPRHPLYALVEQYRGARGSLRASTTQLTELKGECDAVESRVWLRESVTTTIAGRCADGRAVSALHEHEKMTFVDERAAELGQALDRRRIAVFDAHLLLSFKTRMKRYHVREFLQSAVANADSPANNIDRGAGDPLVAHSDEKRASGVSGGTRDARPNINEAYGSSNAVQQAEHIRGCLDVLFTFARSDYDDSAFKVELHEWLRYMASALYHVGAAEDHRFVLHHVARCRSGDGRMLRGLLCVPQRGQWTDAVLDHLLACVWIIAAQDEQDGGDGGSGSWLTMEDGLADTTEPLNAHGKVLGDNDMMVLVDEFQIEALLDHVLNSRSWRRGESSPLDMLAFVDYLFGVLREAFATAARRGHGQIQLQTAELCGKLTTAVASAWGELQSTTAPRVQAEMNDLFERTVLWFRETGSWRFLSQLRYDALSFPSACRLVSILYGGAATQSIASADERLRNSGLPTFTGLPRERFIELMQEGSPQESTHMLRALTQLAISRTSETIDSVALPPHEADFVRRIASELFYVTCVCPGTRETLSRDGRDLFAEFAEQYPPIVSDLIVDIDKYADDIGRAAMYIFGNIPLERWRVTVADIDQVQVWLCGPVQETRHTVAKHIMSKASWCRQLPDGALVIHPQVQLRAALAIARAYNLHGPKQAHSTFSSQIGKLLPTAEDEVFGAWCWSTLLCLRLWDGPGLSATSVQAELAVADLEAHPIHAYVAMMAESATRTFSTFAKWLQILADNGHFEAASVALHCAVPTLVSTSGFQLVANERYLNVVSRLVNADRTVFSFAERLSVHLVSTVHEKHMECVIHDHVNRPDGVGRALGEFWLRSFFAVPSWNTDLVCRRLVNLILKAMFRHPDGRILVQSLLSQEHARQAEAAASTPRSVFSVIASMMSSTERVSFVDGDADAAELCKSWASWIRNGGTLSNEFSTEGLSVWLILETLFMETCQERDVRHAVAGPLVAGAKLSIAVRQYKRIDDFTIYNWARFCGTLPPGTAVLPLFWQMFFCLFFEKHVVNDRGSTTAKGYGHLFFVGKQKTVLTRLYTRLKLLRDHHSAAADGAGDDAQHHARLRELYDNMTRWLEEERFLVLDGRDVRDPSIDVQRLLSVTSIAPWDARDGPYNVWWLDCVGVDVAAAPWDMIRPLSVLEVQNRRIRRGRSIQSTPTEGPVHSNATTKSPGRMVDPHGLVMQCDNPKVFPDLLRACIDVLRAEISRFSARAAQATALDAEFVDQLPKVYSSTQVPYSQLVPCRRILGGTCSGPAAIDYDISEFTVTNSVFQLLKANREELDALVTEVQLPADVFTAAHAIQRACIRLVQQQEALVLARRGASGDSDNVEHDMSPWRQNGQAAFYLMANAIGQDTELYSPTRSLFRSEITRLARCFISTSPLNQRRVLDVIAESPLPAVLLEGFRPHCASQAFVWMYTRASEPKALADPGVAEALLACFDTAQWLDSDGATLASRNKLIDVVAAAVGNTEQRPGQPLSDVVRGHLRNADVILQNRFPECLTVTLRNLLDLSLQKVAPIEWWVLVHNAFTADRGEHFTGRHALQLADWVVPWLETTRADRGTLDVRLGPSFEPLCRVLHLLICRISAEDGPTPFHEQFATLRSLYSPLVCATDDGPPWTSTPEGSKLGRCAAQSLVASVMAFRDRNTALHAMWSFYAEDMVGRNAFHVLDEVHDAFACAGWDGLHISHPLLLQMNAVVTHRDVYSGSLLFGFKVLAAVRWPVRSPTESDPGATAEFQRELLRLVLAVCSERRVVEAPTFGKFWETVMGMGPGEWSALSGRAFDDACSWALERVDHTLMFVPGSPTWHATMLLRRVAHDASEEGDSGPATHSGSSAFDATRWSAHATLMYSLMNKAGKVITAKQVSTYVADTFRRLETVFRGTPEALPVAQPTLCLLTGILNAPVCVGDGGVEVARTIMSTVQSSPLFALPILAAACATVAAQSLVATLAEHCTKIHLECTPVDQLFPVRGWDPIVARLVVPQLDYEVFVTVAIENRCWRVLYAHALQLVRRSAGDSGKELATATAVAGWLDQVTPANDDVDVRNLLLLYGTVINLIAQQASRGLGALRTASMLHSLALSLGKLCEERDSGGILGAIGFGARSSLPADFRLVCRGIGFKIDRVISVSPDFSAALPKGSKSSRAKRLEKHEAALGAILKQRGGAEQFGELVRCVQSVQSAQAPRTVPSIAAFSIELIGKAYPTDPALLALRA